MAAQKSTRTRILEVARSRFWEAGFLRVTMDEIAADLRMSKKTLYQHFPRKEALVRELVHVRMAGFESGVAEVMQNPGLDFVDRMRELTVFLGTQLSQVKPVFLDDLKKGMPDLWREMDDFRREKAIGTIRSLVEEGRTRGVFREEADPSLVALMVANLIQTIITPEALSELPLSAGQAFEAILSVIFQGILADEGRKSYNG